MRPRKVRLGRLEVEQPGTAPQRRTGRFRDGGLFVGATGLQQVAAEWDNGYDEGRGQGGMREFDPDFEVAAYSDVIARHPDFATRYRMVVCDLPRCFHAQPREEQIAAMARPPELTGTRWDALLAAVTEHLAWEHGLEPPRWVHDPERFCDPDWQVTDRPRGGAAGVDPKRFSPPAFRRHGTLIDPRSLDPRGGEKYHWARGWLNTWNLPEWPWENPPAYPWARPA
ncbi:MAG: hypothetical protein OXC19_03735 [Bryobacterales bacterium]|nr:hypothetical protein [Bryobacterales bacterium]